jgi:hypothetical protein
LDFWNYLCLFSDSIINDIVVLHDLLLYSKAEILQTGLLLLQVYIAQTTIKKYFARIELEHETQLGIIDHVISSKVKECIVEICQGLFEIADEEIRYSLLEVCDCEVLVQTDRTLIALNLDRQLAIALEMK